jgi:hypothetical protein
VAQGVGGVNLAAELDGAWQRGRRRAIPGAGSAGGVRAGPAKVSQGPIKSGSHRRWRIETEQGLTGVESRRCSAPSRGKAAARVVRRCGVRWGRREDHGGSNRAGAQGFRLGRYGRGSRGSRPGMPRSRCERCAGEKTGPTSGPRWSASETRAVRRLGLSGRRGRSGPVR